jgi:excisionase family DNA binding protein
MERRGLRVREVAATLGVSRATLYRLLADGQVRGVRLGRKTLIIPADEIDRLLGRSPETQDQGARRVDPESR